MVFLVLEGGGDWSPLDLVLSPPLVGTCLDKRHGAARGAMPRDARNGIVKTQSFSESSPKSFCSYNIGQYNTATLTSSLIYLARRH